MKVVVHPADDGGCGNYRLKFPAAVLARSGADVHIRASSYLAVWQPSPFGDRIIDLAEEVDADVVVLQRPLHRHRVELIDVLQQRGVAVVVELDDDFHALPKRNPCWQQVNPLHDRDHNRDWLMRACEKADLVTCSTQRIADRYAPHGRYTVLPNLVPGWYLDVQHTPLDGARVVVGWTGSTKTHPGDLEVTDRQVAAAVDEYDAVFAVVGTGDGVQKALDLTRPPVALGWQPISDYPAAMATFDVGIVPLVDSPFNDAKSWLKMLEFAAVGVPVIASPTPENRRLNGLGVGVVVYDSVGWWRATSDLIASADLREDIAGQGREVARELTYERGAWRWMEAWAQALANRRGKALVA